ncbi:MAG: bifunctional phosphoribosylaminoimidazolecarboxamide formyltransferase/IMP cyclohydrolase [Candidatus Omnitrophica bacterium]|nr:bifunctional phosphoribosylaminoimidazolecarboxamide formyltransferase/IMP cyclohydrolase [Candidatus Omnitrophota bacterium]
MLKVRRALISVWDKKGIGDFAKRISKLNIEIVSTGKTAKLFRQNNIAVSEVSSLTEFPEILSGRVKTLHPKVFGGILANKKHPLHIEEMRSLNIIPIDMVVVNLYPFAAKLKDKLTTDEILEYIDIGGHSLLRAAAKNYKNVVCISSREQYKSVIEELEKNKGFISQETLRDLAAAAFYLAKEYDNDIYGYFNPRKVVTWDWEKLANLRYGENPHQKAGLYRLLRSPSVKFEQIQGKELSYNNFMDLDTALCCVKEFSDPAAVIVKHSTPCGVGTDKKLVNAYKKAYSADPLSSFGGIVGFNRKVDKFTAQALLKSGFKECVIAPAYSKEALKYFAEKKNLRIIEIDFSKISLGFKGVRAGVFGYLIQDSDTQVVDKSKFKVVTEKKPTQSQMKDLVFAWKVVKHVKSNAIVAVKNGNLLGIGGGQPSRVGAVKIALGKSSALIKGAVLASDAFFPKEDSIKLAYRKGIRAIICPGGSIKDQEVIDCCNKYGIAMIFTGIRHFRH